MSEQGCRGALQHMQWLRQLRTGPCSWQWSLRIRPTHYAPMVASLPLSAHFLLVLLLVRKQGCLQVPTS
jgi:hypothetical protein